MATKSDVAVGRVDFLMSYGSNHAPLSRHAETPLASQSPIVVYLVSAITISNLSIHVGFEV